MTRVTDIKNAAYLQPQERIAVFDNDCTLWCEKQVQVQIDFILRRLAAMAEKDPSLRQQQPWQAAYYQDTAWFSDTVTQHYHDDDSQVKVLLGGVLKAFGAMTVEAFEEMAAGRRPLIQH